MKMNGKTQILAVAAVVVMVAAAFVGIGYAYQAQFNDSSTGSSTATTGYIQINDVTFNPTKALDLQAGTSKTSYFYSGVTTSAGASVTYKWTAGTGSGAASFDAKVTSDVDGTTALDADAARIMDETATTGTWANTYNDGKGFKVQILYAIGAYQVVSSDTTATSVTVKASALPVAVASATVKYVVGTDAAMTVSAAESATGVNFTTGYTLGLSSGVGSFFVYAMVEYTIADPSASTTIETLAISGTSPIFTVTVDDMKQGA